MWNHLSSLAVMLQPSILLISTSRETMHKTILYLRRKHLNANLVFYRLNLRCKTMETNLVKLSSGVCEYCRLLSHRAAPKISEKLNSREKLQKMWILLSLAPMSLMDSWMKQVTGVFCYHDQFMLLVLGKLRKPGKDIKWF